MEEAKPTVYKKSSGLNLANEEKKRKRAQQNKAGTKKNLFCRGGDGVNGELEFKHGGKKITGCKYCCRTKETMKRHELQCKHVK